MSEFWYALLWATFVLPLIFLWIFTFIDLFGRKDIGWSKVLWAMAILFLPLIGVIAYFIARPKEDSWASSQTMADGYAPGPYSTGSQTSGAVRDIETLIRLHDTGALSDEEFARMKDQILRPSPSLRILPHTKLK